MDARQRVFLVLGGAAVLAALMLAAVGRAEIRPFALAFVGSVASEAIVSRSISRSNEPLRWRSVVSVLAAIAAWALLTVAAIRAIQAPMELAGPISVILGLIGGKTLGDAVFEVWSRRRRDER